jgi:hypothetical protein
VDSNFGDKVVAPGRSVAGRFRGCEQVKERFDDQHIVFSIYASSTDPAEDQRFPIMLRQFNTRWKT